MITKAPDVPITKTSPNKIRLQQGEYEWGDTRGLIRKDGPNIIYLLFKSINQDTRISVSNLNMELRKQPYPILKIM